ncbi:MAG TPA: NUDIX domain-containing protein, partial [Gemmatimonadales bacterium]|nr:NUDIX domain-containing protein [Gemmatimonadales bacterium]
MVFRCTPRGPKVLLILDGHGNWGFPKGHVERREAQVDAARREVLEETGLEQLQLVQELGTLRWWFQRRGVRVRKQCGFYLF